MDAFTPPSFLQALFDAGLLYPTGVDGLFGRSGRYDAVLEAVRALITRAAAPAEPELFRFPPGMSEAHYKQSGHYANFPHFTGAVHHFCGDERTHRRALACMDAGTDWSEGQAPGDIVLVPAACYPLYPVLAQRGPVPAEGYLAGLTGWCFRREPSLEPTRMQMFQMQEVVRVGTAAQVLAFRAHWMEAGDALFGQLLLPHAIEVANDPFFGRAGTLLASSQRSQELKFEMVVPVNEGAGPTACCSFNYHMDHFGEACGLHDEAGARAHSACIGFGLDRITLALLRHHGTDPARWPGALRATLWGDQPAP